MVPPRQQWIRVLQGVAVHLHIRQCVWSHHVTPISDGRYRHRWNKVEAAGMGEVTLITSDFVEFNLILFIWVLHGALLNQVQPSLNRETQPRFSVSPCLLQPPVAPSSHPMAPPSPSTNSSTNNSSSSSTAGWDQLSKTNLYIRGLSPSTTDHDLVKLCQPWVPHFLSLLSSIDQPLIFWPTKFQSLVLICSGSSLLIYIWWNTKKKREQQNKYTVSLVQLHAY